jgi:hypothetical protein
MVYTLQEFSKKYNLKIKLMDIDRAVSPYPRTILLTECPKCKNNLFLSHPMHRPDPFIELKREEGIYGVKYPKNRRWLVSCWTNNCDFYIALSVKDLAQCPECKQYFIDDYSLYDHMRFQCTRRARTLDMLKKANVDKYMGALVVTK